MTLPWVIEAQKCGKDDWNRLHEIKRALRRGGGTSGFVDDWIYDSAMTQEEAQKLAEQLTRSGTATLADLCECCRHYQEKTLRNHCQVF